MALSETVLRARNLYRFYHAGDDETFALRGVALDVAAGELVAVVGPSGSGKSTLLACLAGLDVPDGGSVEICGERISRRGERERASIRGSRIGVMSQSGNLLDILSVEDNLRAAMSLGGRIRETRIGELLDRVGLHAHRRAYPATLSGGEVARASLAVALANDPALVLADEPTAELDAHTSDAILRLLRDARAQGTAMLIATHSHALAGQADRVLKMADGAFRA